MLSAFYLLIEPNIVCVMITVKSSKQLFGVETSSNFIFTIRVLIYILFIILVILIRGEGPSLSRLLIKRWGIVLSLPLRLLGQNILRSFLEKI